MHHLVGPLVEKRHLWNVLAKTFIKGANAWNLVDKYSTSTDRHLGTYYRVQFQDSQGVYIYRETELATLCMTTNEIITPEIDDELYQKLRQRCGSLIFFGLYNMLNVSKSIQIKSLIYIIFSFYFQSNHNNNLFNTE